MCLVTAATLTGLLADDDRLPRRRGDRARGGLIIPDQDPGALVAYLKTLK